MGFSEQTKQTKNNRKPLVSFRNLVIGMPGKPERAHVGAPYNNTECTTLAQKPPVFAWTADVRHKPSESAHYPLGLFGRGSQVNSKHRPLALDHDAQILHGRSKLGGLLLQEYDRAATP